MGAYREPSAARSIVIDIDSAVPLYRQIANGLRAVIARGGLTEGEPLPSVRKLGGMLGVNLNTVAKAYRLLAEEGVVELRKGSAARVAAPPKGDASIDASGLRALDDFLGRARLRGASEAEVREVFEAAVRRFFRKGEV
jgi:GntR family transcriptional regulator